MSNKPGKPLPELLYQGEIVAVIQDAELYDWPWMGGTLVPCDFPKDLADSLAWVTTHDEDDSDEEPSRSLFYQGWSLCWPNGRIENITIGNIDFARAWIEWR